MLDIRGASDTKLKIYGTMALLRMVESRTGANFVIIQELIVPVFSATIYIERFIKAIHAAKSKFVRHNSLTVTVFMRQDRE